MRDRRVQEWLSRPGGLIERLRSMRRQSGLRGHDIAEQLGWATSKVSKIENVRQLPSADDVRGWARVCGCAEEGEELAETLGELDTVRVEWVHQATVGDAEAQAEHDHLARQATLVRNFALAVMPGLLQVPAYASLVMAEAYRTHEYDSATLDQAIAARIRRQEVLWDQSDRRFDFIIAESCFRFETAPPSVMLAQFDRLMTISGLPNIGLAVLPFACQGRTPLNSFVLYDDLVVVETYNEQTYYPGRSQLHASIYDDLWSISLQGDEMRAFIRSQTERLDPESSPRS